MLSTALEAIVLGGTSPSLYLLSESLELGMCSKPIEFTPAEEALAKARVVGEGALRLEPSRGKLSLSLPGRGALRNVFLLCVGVVGVFMLYIVGFVVSCWMIY